MSLAYAQPSIRHDGISVQDESWINRAGAIAADVMDSKYRIGAIVVRSGNPIGLGVNKLRNYDHHRILDRVHWGIHAEIAAIGASRNTVDGCTLYVARLGRNNNHRMAKPCEMCQISILDSGIKRVVYTTNWGIESLSTREWI